jgi:hypothetical protein
MDKNRLNVELATGEVAPGCMLVKLDAVLPMAMAMKLLRFCEQLRDDVEMLERDESESP